MQKTNRAGRVLSLAVGVSLILAAGCSRSGGTPQASGEGSKTAEPQKPFEVSISIWDIEKNIKPGTSDKLLEKIETDFNLKFKTMNVGWNDYKEKFKLWSASGELPDTFVTDYRNDPTLDSWIQQGLIRPLPDDMSKYPNLAKLVKQPDVAPLKRNGKFYFLPRLSVENPDEWALERGLVVRKDWMEKLNLKMPETFDEYVAMFKLFAEKDPDGNGKADTIGLTHNFIDVLNTTIKLGALPNVNGWVKDGDKWVPGWASSGMSDYIAQYKRLYDEGALDKDFAILKVGDGGDKFAQGVAGALAIQISQPQLNGLKAKWDKYQTKSFEDSVVVMPVWKHKDGNRYRFYGASSWSDIYFSSKVDDKTMDALLKWIDFAHSEEGFRLYNYGIEGKDYKLENKQVVLTREKDANGKPKSLTEFYPSLGSVGSYARSYSITRLTREVRMLNTPEKIVDMADAAMKFHLQNLKPEPINFAVEFIQTPAKTKIGGIKWSDEVVKIVLSKDGNPQKLWEEAMKSFEAKGLSQAIKEVNDEVAKMNIR